jgi:sugar lactone lactonase YvrE
VQKIHAFIAGALLLAVSAAGATAADSLKFSETYSRSVSGGAVMSGGGVCGVTARIALDGVDISQFNGSTTFDASIGNFNFSAELSADPKYAPGKTSVTILSRDANVGKAPTGTVVHATFSWTASALSVNLSALTPQAGPPAVADAFVASPGAIKSGATAVVSFAGVKREFAVALTGRSAAKTTAAGTTISVALSGAGVPVSGEHRVGEGKFFVDAQTDEVTVGGDRPQTRAVFRGSTIVFNSSQLLDQPGDSGRKVLQVSFTNRSGEPIGQMPNGTVTGMRVLFSAFTNTGSFTAPAAQTTVNTTAGTGAAGGANGPVGSATFNSPQGVAVDGSGAIYVSDFTNNKLRKIKNGFVSTLAGSGSAGGTNGLGTAATFNGPNGIALNPVDGALIVVDNVGDRVRRVTPEGRVTLVAGTGAAGGSDGAGGSATFSAPRGVAVDAGGAIYVTDNHRIRKVVLTSGADPTLPASYTVSTLAGTSTSGLADGTGSAAGFNTPSGIAVDSGGTLYVADSSNNKIRRISAAGEVVAIAGTGAAGTTDGAGSAATFNTPKGIATLNGALVVSDKLGNKIRQLTLDSGASPGSADSWRVSTLAGTGAVGSTDGSGTAATFNGPALIAADGSNNVYIPDFSNNKIRKLAPTNGSFPVGVESGSAPAEQVQLDNADGVIPNQGAGANLPFINYAQSLQAGGTSAVQKWAFLIPSGVTAFQFTVSVEANTDTLAPPFAVDNSATPGSGAGSPNVDVRTLAGVGGSLGFIDGIAFQARFDLPVGVAVDRAGNLYVPDENTNAIRRISAAGIVSTVAGDVGVGTSGSTDGAGNFARFSGPSGVAVTLDGMTLFVADESNDKVRRIVLTSGSDPANPASWIVSTIAGTGASGSADGTGDVATLSAPNGIALDAGGNLFVTENFGNRVRRLQFKGGDPSVASNWEVSLVAGDPGGSTGTADGTGAAARFNGPADIAVDRAGTLYVADESNHRIRKITSPGAFGGGAVTTLAGSTSGYADGVGSAALFTSPFGIAVDSAGFIYVTDISVVGDSLVGRIRRVSPGGVVETVAGTGTVGFADGTGDMAKFTSPYGLAVDAAGNLYVADNFTIRLIQRVLTTGAP